MANKVYNMNDTVKGLYIMIMARKQSLKRKRFVFNRFSGSNKTASYIFTYYIWDQGKMYKSSRYAWVYYLKTMGGLLVRNE